MTLNEHETEVNIPLLRKAVEWVEEQDQLPEQVRQWDQTWWVTPEDHRVTRQGLAEGCGTAYCVAGWIAAQKYPELAHTSNAFSPTGEVLYSAGVATQLLGINEDQADVLFAATNSASDVRKTAEWIAGERL